MRICFSLSHEETKRYGMCEIDFKLVEEKLISTIIQPPFLLNEQNLKYLLTLGLIMSTFSVSTTFVSFDGSAFTIDKLLQKPIGYLIASPILIIVIYLFIRFFNKTDTKLKYKDFVVYP